MIGPIAARTRRSVGYPTVAVMRRTGRLRRDHACVASVAGLAVVAFWLPALTDFGLRFVFVVLLLSGLSFLGLGIQPPNADWGSLVRENIEGLSYGAPAVIVPALAIATLTIGVNLMIDALPGRRRAGTEQR